jgi:protein-S-isoprenylcysteine O-methyltransferase Ste14
VQRVQPASGRPLRLAAVVLAVGLLLAVVSFASRSGFGHSTNTAANPTYVSYAFTLFLILFVAMIPLALWAMFVTAGEKQSTNDNKRQGRRLVKTLILLAIAALIYLFRHHLHLNLHTPQRLAPLKGQLRAAPHAPPPSHAGGRAPQFEWPVLFVILAVLAVAAAAFVVLRRRRTVPVAPEPSVAEDVAASISDAIDDLEREEDPRRAVIAAYARMEGVLGRHGLRRHPSETSIEYLRRVLNQLTTSGGAVERLTSLFEAAKFSDHAVTPAMKGDAIAALRGVRDGLAT